MFDFHTIEDLPTNVHTLNAGVYFVADKSWKISVQPYRSIGVVFQCDPTGADESEVISVEWNGAEVDFNTIEEAYNFIDTELDTDYGFDPVREWGTHGR